MSKTLCKSAKEKIEKVMQKQALFYCSKCHKVAHKEKYLCKPGIIKKEQ